MIDIQLTELQARTALIALDTMRRSARIKNDDAYETAIAIIEESFNAIKHQCPKDILK